MLFHFHDRKAAILALAWAAAACGSSSDSGLTDLASASDAGADVSNAGGAAGGAGGSGSLSCTSDRHCTPHGLLCLAAESRCVECVETADCEDGHDCVDHGCVRRCTNSLDCPAGEVCNRDTGRCVECVTHDDCEGEQRCTAGACSSPCVSDRECTPHGQLCDIAAGVCVDPAGADGGQGTGGGGTTPAERPLDLFFTFDVSGSMNRDVGTETRFTIVRDGLVSFLREAESADLGAGIVYFPGVVPGAPSTCTTDADCEVDAGDFGTCVGGIAFLGCTAGLCNCSGADSCEADSYAEPAVPFALPPSPEPVAESLLARQRPEGGTPLRAALEGAHGYAGGWAAQHPQRRVVVVLVGDGEPQGCTNNTLSDSEAIVQAALEGPHPIPTFVVGVGPSLENLNRVAAAGGTEEAYLMSDTEAQTEFTVAMRDIRRRAGE